MKTIVRLGEVGTMTECKKSYTSYIIKVMNVFQNKDTLKFENRIPNVVTLPRVAEMNATRGVGACDAWILRRCGDVTIVCNMKNIGLRFAYSELNCLTLRT